MRRRAAARLAGLDVVPVSVFASADELDIREALVHSNKGRDKTTDMKAREAQTLMEIERKRAQERQREGQRVGGKARHRSLPAPVPESCDAGDARDKVAEALGVSGKMVDALVQSAEAIDTLESQGKHKEAEEVRQTLNGRGARPAAQLARKLCPTARRVPRRQPAAAAGTERGAAGEAAA